MLKLGGVAKGIGGPASTRDLVKKIHAGPVVRNDPGDWLRCPDHHALRGGATMVANRRLRGCPQLFADDGIRP